MLPGLQELCGGVPAHDQQAAEGEGGVLGSRRALYRLEETAV